MPPAPQNILVIKLGALGDMVFADGVLRALRAHHPHATITLLTSAPYRGLMAKCPHIDQIGPSGRPRSWRLREVHRLKQALRQGGFDFVYDLQNSAYSRRQNRWLRHVPINGRSRFCRPRYRRDKSRRVAEAVYLAEQVGLAGIDVGQIPPADMRWAAAPVAHILDCLLYTSPSPRDATLSRMPSSA